MPARIICWTLDFSEKMLLERMFQLGKMPELRLGTLMATSAIWQQALLQLGLVRQNVVTMQGSTSWKQWCNSATRAYGHDKHIGHVA
jgi:hypothetical protein